MDLKTRMGMGNREHFKKIKLLPQKEVITYEPNERAPTYIKKKQNQREIDNSTIMDKNVYIPLSRMDRINRQKISKEIEDFKNSNCCYIE